MKAIDSCAIRQEIFFIFPISKFITENMPHMINIGEYFILKAMKRWLILKCVEKSLQRR